MPFTVVQLTDCHLGARWGADPATTLAAVVEHVMTVLHGEPDAVLVTGDIAHAGTDAQYEQTQAALEPLGAPVYVLPGNHDDRAALRRHFELSDTGREDLSYAVSLGPLRLVALDTKRSGQDSGEIDPARLGWLAQALAEDRETPTLLAMHHPPLRTGMPVMDAIGVPAPERAALGELLAGHPQVRLVVAGHVHRLIAGSLGATPVLAIPSTNLQLALDLAATEFHFVPEPPSFAVHLLLDGEIVSHIAPVAGCSRSLR